MLITENGSDYMKNISYQINTNAEKAIIALSASVALAILFDGKNKKPEKRKSFVKRVSKNYKSIDSALMRIASKSIKEQKEKEYKAQFKTKLRELEIEGSEPIDAELLTR